MTILLKPVIGHYCHNPAEVAEVLKKFKVSTVEVSVKLDTKVCMQGSV